MPGGPKSTGPKSGGSRPPHNGNTKAAAGARQHQQRRPPPPGPRRRNTKGSGAFPPPPALDPDDPNAPPLEGPDARAPMSDAARAALDRARSDASYLANLSDKKLRGQLRHVEGVYAGAAVTAARAGEWLLPEDAGMVEAEGELERTWRLKQQDLAAMVPQGAARKAFDLALPDLGPYSCAFSRAGKHVVLGGARGHLAVLEWQRAHLTCELQVREPVRDVCFLHNEQYFAAAQRKHAYIYDKRGVELHRLDAGHPEPRALQFLPHHFLLASAGGDVSGTLTYQDVSTGELVAQHRTKLGACSVMAQNPHNAVLVLGHGNGTVTMWTPNQTTPVVRMLVHRGPVRAVAVDPSGKYLVTAGADRRVKVWDVRTYAPLVGAGGYRCDAAPTAVDVSQRGMMAVAMSNARVQVWPREALQQKAQSPYLAHSFATGAAKTVAFAPYEDALAAGTAGGMSTMLVPGSGEPNFDSWVVNPLATLRERRAQEVAQLLDKLQPDTIVLDPERRGVGALRREPAAVAAERAAEAAAANAARLAQARERTDGKKRMKGKNKPTRRQHRKQMNVVEDKRGAVGKAMQREAERKAERERLAAEEREQALRREVPGTLHRFYK
jgi:U3 small nucleolar RNA-associated protein 7